MSIDIEKVRNDIANYGNKIFFNSAGASLVPHSVVEKINHYLSEEEKYGGYKLQDMRVDEINNFYREAAILLNTRPENIAFAHDATDAYTKALSSIPFERGDTIITTDLDYASNQIQFISLHNRIGIEVVRARNLESGDLDLSHLEELIQARRPKLVAVTHVPTNSGLVQDVEAIGSICQKYNTLFLVDACQSVGQLVVDVDKVKCDFLTTTGRKFLRGPRGTGLLYVSDRVLDSDMAPLFIDGRGAIWTDDYSFKADETAIRFQTWEAPIAMIIGFSEALRYANEIGIQNIEKYNEGLMKHCRDSLAEVKGIQMYDRGSRKCNILTIRKEGKSLEELANGLESADVFCNISTFEWGLIDYREKGIDGSIRLSPHYFNTKDEVNRLAKILDDI